MMEFTRPATWEDVKSLARLLDEAGVEYALIGGYALAAHGFSRFTEDIDILVNPSAENSRRWIMALAKLPDGAARELAAAPDVFAGGQRYAIRINDEFTVDVLPAAADLDWEEARLYLTTCRIDDVTIHLLDLPGLLRSKRTSRPRDAADAELIEAALESRK
ncbi:MAG: hypothetical protein EPO25_12510 [Gammaproteobacteria bacterium]|nr:MAG: hypothetical protein EPO25_12510 [Gammaproteobacteria bacterium]